MTAAAFPAPLAGPSLPALTYREGMGRILLFLLAALAVFLLVSLVISALHFLFWIALLALIVVGALRVSSGMRRWSRR